MTSRRVLHDATARPATATAASWWDEAACYPDYVPFSVPGNPDGWLNEDGQYRAAAAGAICVNCPVINECLDEAIRVGDKDTFRGGMTPQERAALVRSQKRPSRSKETV